MDILADHEFVVGTYEEHVLGFRVNKKELEASFTNHAHSGSIKSLAAAGKFLVSGAADEQVRIFNLRNRREHGSLHHHDATVTSLIFYDDKHLMSGSDDGKICIVETKGWRVEKTLMKHSAGITDMCIHPSGKLALSVAKDRKLITWNLIKGRSAYVSNVKDVADFVRFSSGSGSHFVVGFYKRVDVYQTDKAAVVFTIPLKGRANSAAFLSEDVFALAGEMADIEFYSIKDKKQIHKFKAHETRVRCVQLVQNEDDEKQFAMITASNDGFIKVWRLNFDGNKIQEALVLAHDTKCRITHLVVHKVPEVKVNERSGGVNTTAVDISEEVTVEEQDTPVKPSVPAKRKGEIIVESDSQSKNERKKKRKGKGVK